MGCNFAVILPIWDVIFRTWRRAEEYPRTGVASLAGPPIHCGYLRHQLEGFRRLGIALAHLRRPPPARLLSRPFAARQKGSGRGGLIAPLPLAAPPRQNWMAEPAVAAV